MLDTLKWTILVIVLLGIALLYSMYRRKNARKQSNVTQFPTHWELRLRPLFSDIDRSVWLWLKQVFPEHEVLVKVPVIRFLSGSTGDLKAMIQIKDIYCSFTICSPKGRVLGCIDIPGAQGLKASRRDLKKKLFDSFGLPYAVLGPKDLPTQEALRALFLNETLPQLPIASQFEASHLSQVSDYPAQVEMPDFTKMPESIPEPMKVSIPVQVQASIPVPVPVSVSLDPVGDVRHNLHIKLEGNRKRRLAAMESLKASAGVVEDTTAPGSGSRWDDSFIMGEGPAHSVH